MLSVKIIFVSGFTLFFYGRLQSPALSATCWHVGVTRVYCISSSCDTVFDALAPEVTFGCCLVSHWEFTASCLLPGFRLGSIQLTRVTVLGLIVMMLMNRVKMIRSCKIAKKKGVPLGSKSPYKPPYKEDVIWCAGVQPYLISFSTL